MSELLLEVLQKTLSQSPDDQRRALEFLKDASDRDFPTFVKELSVVLRTDQCSSFVRQAAGLQLKNVLCAKEEERRNMYLNRWLQLPVDIRAHVKTQVVGTLGTESSRPSIAAQCVAAIACAELPSGLWPDVIAILMGSVTNPASGEMLKESSLETLGYICQDINARVLETQANSILTAIVHGMRKEESSNHVRLAATNALFNALEFTNNNFHSDPERHIIMQVVCEASQSTDMLVKVASLQCLVRIVTLYYQLMEGYMQALFPITVQAMKSEEDNVCLQGIEFWSNICEEEIALAVEAEEAAGNNIAPEKVSRHYAKGATPHLCPLLLETLAKQDEADDDDDWTPCKAAGVCIMLLAQCVGDDILQCVLPFFPNFTNSNWKYKDAAIMAFGSILDGPDPSKLQPLVEQAMPLLIEALSDKVVTVRDSTAWTIGRILEVCPEIVANDALLKALLPAFSRGLHQEPRVASNICWALMALVKAVYEHAASQGTDGTGQPETYALSSCFQGMVDELIKTTDRADSNQSNLRLAAFETLMELIKNSPKDCYPVVQQTTIVMLRKLEQLLNMEAAATSSSDKSAVVDLQALLCATLHSVLLKMRPEDAPCIADHIMTGLLQIMSRATGKTGTCMEEALLAVSALAETLTTGFGKYIDALRPHILQALTNYEDSQVCVAAAGLMIDICRAMDQTVTPALDEIMQQLVMSLREPRLARDAKVEILGTFGDIALAIGEKFERYIDVVMSILNEASGALATDPDDYDQVDYVDKLRENIVSAYVGILQSRCPDNFQTDQGAMDRARQSVCRYVDSMGQIIMKCAEQKPDPSDSLLAVVSGLIGDLVILYGKEIVPLLHNEKVNSLLAKGKKSKTAKTKATAGWAIKEIRKVAPAH